MFKLLESERIEIPLKCFELALQSSVKVKDFIFGIRVFKRLFMENVPDALAAPSESSKLKNSFIGTAAAVERKNAAEWISVLLPREVTIPGFEIDKNIIIWFIRMTAGSNHKEVRDK